MLGHVAGSPQAVVDTHAPPRPRLRDPLASCAGSARAPLAPPTPQPRASGASCAPSRSPTSTATSSTSSSATSCARAAAAACSSRPKARAAATSRPCPTATSRSPTSSSRPRSGTALQIPVSVAFFFVNSTLDRVAAFYPEPAGATESLLPLDTWDEHRQPPTPSSRRCSPTSRRSSFAPTGRRARCECFLVPIDACYELVGQLRRLWQGFDGGQRGARRARRVLRRTCRATGTMTDSRLRSRCSTHAPEPYAAVPTIMLRTADHRARPERTVHAVALRCQIRIEPQRRRYEHEEEQRLVELFGEPPRGATRCGRSCGRTWRRPSPASRARPRSTCRSTCTLRLRGRGRRSSSIRSTTARSRSCCCSPGTAFTRSERGMNVAPVAWHADASFRLPVAVWRQMMDLYFPNSGWVMLSRDTLDALTQFKADRALADAGTSPSSSSSRKPVRTCERRPVRSRARRRRRGALRGLRPVPLPGLGAEEPGALAVRRARAAGPARSRAV